MNVNRTSRRWWLGWMLLAAPALIQLVLLLSAVLQRLPYPYDLEWMEGGILVHASRIADGSGIYVPPSLDFIPFLYTPLYPGLLALLQPFVGISYQVARGISFLSILGLVGLCFGAVVPRVDRRDRKAAVAGGIIATGFFCATYPWVDGWYDIARGDTLFLLMAAGGVTAASAWARTSWGWRGHARVAMAGALLALSFFCKQTGIFFVAAGGAIVLVKNWRRVPAYVAAAGAVGLGGTALLQRVTGGWFWIYAFKVHQTHDCNSDRFWHGFSEMLGKFPLMTATIALGLVLVAATAIVRRRLPRSAEPLLVWTWVLLVGLVVGSVGIATQWSHRNAYIPAMFTGAVAAGAALPAILGTLTELLGERPRAREMAHAGAMLVLAALVVDLALFQRWSPARFVPKARDRAAGAALVDQIRSVDGEVFVPFHPWYAHLAGKRVYTHRMGVLDMRYRPPARPAHECFFANPAGKPNWKVAGLPDAFTRAYFAAVFWDNRGKNYFDGFERYYRLDDTIPKNERPRLFTGARDLVPTEIWVPAVEKPPPAGAQVLFAFESGTFDGWEHTGSAWGARPERGPLRSARQGPVRHYGGRWFATSMHGGDGATGVLTSPPFVLQGARITFRLGGGVEPKQLTEQARDPADTHTPWLRAELWVDGKPVRWVSKPGKPSERLEEVHWIIPEYEGQTARLVIVDQATGGWAHLNVDDVWLWKK